jgi:hypothetical protein
MKIKDVTCIKVMQQQRLCRVTGEYHEKLKPAQPVFGRIYRGAVKSLARPEWKKLKGRQFSSDTEVIAAAETWLDGQLPEIFLSGLQKLVCSL